MSNKRIDDLTELEERFKDGLNWNDMDTMNLIAELKRMYKQEKLLWKAFMLAGEMGCYLTICEECDDVHIEGVECPLICEYCCETDCECLPSEEG